VVLLKIEPSHSDFIPPSHESKETPSIWYESQTIVKSIFNSKRMHSKEVNNFRKESTKQK